MKTDTNQPAGLYVHVPFCRTKCHYCDFYSVSSTSLTAEWLQGVEQEALLYKDRFPLFDTLYLGGGTPTVLTERQISGLVEALHRHFRFSPAAEVTLEANPDDITADKLKTYTQMGFNRISLGVQSMEDRDLTFLGRRHTAGQAARAMELVRLSGFSQFGMDLIYGLPGQTGIEWEESLRKALAFSPDHLSCYQLTVSPGTRLGKRLTDGLVEPLEEERERELFLLASEVLEKEGYFHYEVSNYARRGEGPHLCRHNMKYWERSPTLGLGPSAHSFQGKERWWNHRSLERYVKELSRGRRPVRGRERLSEEQASLERLALLLRTRVGVPIEELDGYANSDRVLPALLEAGYLERIDGRAAPTREGFLVADRLPLLFF